jgi:glycosyltransferase involved in cell wall biosynthesis
MRSAAFVTGSERATDLRLALLTLGDPNRLTGGHRYNAMMAAAAPLHGAAIRSRSLPPGAWDHGALAAAVAVHGAARGVDGLLLDSLVAAPAAPWIARAAAPVVSVVHQAPGGVDHGRARSMVQRALDLAAYRRSAGVIVSSDGLAETLLGARVPAELIRVVPPGCDVPAADGAPLDLRRGRLAAVLCVANWSPSKGIIELLDAFATLPEPAATLWLVGAEGDDRPYAARVRRRVGCSDLSERVVVCGARPIENVGRMYRSADVFALCSFADVYGTAWTEAIAAGLPVVGWKTANLPRLVEDGREGLLAEPGDQRALASALRVITSDAVTRERLASGARRRAKTLPKWRASTSAFFGSVRELLGKDVRNRTDLFEPSGRRGS